MTTPLGIGVIGCGNISAAYMRLAPRFPDIEMRACADLDPDAAAARAAEFGLRATSPKALLAADDVDIVLNLTVPATHHAVSRAALEAGKHVYSEKPFVLSLEEGLSLQHLAEAQNLRVGSAPDTFLGGAHQLGRHLLDAGAIGEVTSGTCFVQSPGMEMWHPNPDFFFKAGGGPVLDLGPYYVSNLVQLLGPVARVTAMSTKGRAERTIGSGPRAGETIGVETPTTIHAILAFASGAQVTFCASWDVWAHGHAHMELYGNEGTLFLPDPNFFGGEVRLTHREETAALPSWEHPFARPNQEDGQANYRAAGLADMAQAISQGRDHRCSLAFSLHVVDVMLSILEAGESGQVMSLTTTCDRPAPLSAKEAQALLA